VGKIFERGEYGGMFAEASFSELLSGESAPTLRGRGWYEGNFPAVHCEFSGDDEGVPAVMPFSEDGVRMAWDGKRFGKDARDA
jgi:hypothetical protein